MKTYLIFGKSGCGKSYLVKRIMLNLNINESNRKKWKEYTYYNKGNFYILGKYDIRQAGLDSQPKNIQEFVSYLRTVNENAVLLCEGYWYDHKIEYRKKFYLNVSTEKCTELKRKRNAGKNFKITEKQIKRWNSIENSKEVKECVQIPYNTDDERDIALKFFLNLFEKFVNETNTEKKKEGKLF